MRITHRVTKKGVKALFNSYTPDIHHTQYNQNGIDVGTGEYLGFFIKVVNSE